MTKATLLILVIAACGGGAKPAPAHAEPTPGVRAERAPASGGDTSALTKELGELEEQNAAHLGAMRELETSIQAVDDSEDAPAARRAALNKLLHQREELVKAVTATRDRAKTAASTRDVDPDLIKRAEEQRERADKSLRELDDLKTQIANIARRL